MVDCHYKNNINTEYSRLSPVGVDKVNAMTRSEAVDVCVRANVYTSNNVRCNVLHQVGIESRAVL